ncbi:MAG: U3 snoRNA-associated protein 12, DIP2 [Amphiamblys sp. WSBS2006]|nr:MAG: U3 snoRNA-associated protein 12, DIP2 [Amphiamblys sp. WSBS2006]
MDECFYRYKEFCRLGLIYTKKSRPVYAGKQNMFLVGVLNTVSLFDTNTEEQVSLFTQGHSPVTCIEPGRETFAVGYEDGAVCVLSYAGELQKKISAHQSAVLSICYTGAGDCMVTVGMDNRVVVWDILDDTVLARIRGPKKPATAACFIGDSVVAVSAKDSTIRVFSVETGECLQLVSAAKEKILSLCADEEKKTLVFTVKKTGVFACRINTASKRQPLELVGCIEQNPKAIYATVSSGLICFLSHSLISLIALPGDSGECTAASFVKKHGVDVSPHVVSACLSQGSKTLLLGLDNNSLEIFTKRKKHYKKEREITQKGHRTWIKTVSISTDDKHIASFSSEAAHVWDVVATAETVGLSFLSTLDCRGAQCSEFIDEEHVVVGTSDGKISVYNIGTGKETCTVNAHSGKINTLHLFSQKTRLLSGGGDKTLRVWSVSPKQIDPVFEHGFNEDITCVRYIEAQNLICVALLDSTIGVFYADTMRRFLSLYGHKLPINSLCIAEDEKLLVSCSVDKSIRVWSLDFGDCRKTITGHSSSVTHVWLDGKTKTLLSASARGDIRQWTFPGLSPLGSVGRHHDEVSALSFSEKTGLLVTGSRDLSLRVWSQTSEEVFPEDVQEEAFEERLDEEMERRIEVSHVREQVTDSVNLRGLKDGELLLKALERSEEESKKAEALGDTPASSTTLFHAGQRVSPAGYFYAATQTIAAMHLEDALLAVPTHMTPRILSYLLEWSSDDEKLLLSCRMLSFFVKGNLDHIAQQTKLKQTVTELRDTLQKKLAVLKRETQKNIAGLRQIQRCPRLPRTPRAKDEDR